MRIWRSYQINDEQSLRPRLLQFAQRYDAFALLDSCDNHVYGQPSFDFLLAAGVSKFIECNAGNAFEKLNSFLHDANDFCFGFFGYDLKNEIENLRSENADYCGFSDMVFFIPELIARIKGNQLEIGILHEATESAWSELKLSILANADDKIKSKNEISLTSRIPHAAYLKIIEQIREHIAEGDLYEMNFCQEFFADYVVIDPFLIFQKLCEYSKAPFSVLFKWNNNYLISASPERFLKKKGNHLISQPIKGTIRRGSNMEEDEDLKKRLFNSSKDRAENVMIVDLVRNDLTKSGETGSIKVDELFGIKSFEHVHQMVSTISATAKENMDATDIIRNAFPMGSMTGAPKVMAMELIEQYEKNKRGLYSGAFGYFTPEQDFDFNVVIRSIIYSAQHKYLSVQAGGAIVYDSVPEEEYRECLVKLEGLKQVLNG